MKHNKEYKFNTSITEVHDVVQRLHDLSYDYYTYQKIILADGTEHQFIGRDNVLREMPDLDAALALVLEDIYLLKDLYDNNVIVEAE